MEVWNQAGDKVNVTVTESGIPVLPLLLAVTAWNIDYLRCDSHQQLAKRKSYHHPCLVRTNRTSHPSEIDLIVTVNLPMQT